MMRARAAALLAPLLLANTPLPVPAEEHAAAVRVARAAEQAERSGFAGTVLIGFPAWESQTCHPVREGCAAERWRWASVTKQVVATLVMQEVAAGRVSLDAPIATYLPRFQSANAGTISVPSLLQHRTGLPNPDDTPAPEGAMPAYYRADFTGDRDPLAGYCAGAVKGPAGAAWAYNNCDYIVAGALLESVTGKRWEELVAARIARPLGLATLAAAPATATVAGTVDGRPEPIFSLETFGAAGALTGTAADLHRFDRALMAGTLLPAAARDALWAGDPALGFMALGQWSFAAPLKGCAGPVRIVERRGEIGGSGVRNFILPERGLVLIAFTSRGGFDFGEVWQGRGVSHDLLAAAACGAPS